VGIESAIGPGRPDPKRSKAPWISPAMAAPSRIASAHRQTGRKQSIWFGTSWSAPTSCPTSACGTSDMTASTGIEPAYDSASGVSVLRAPGPVVTRTTPTRPEERA